MRILFVSDIHRVPSTLSAALEQGEHLGYDRLVLLGDLLYHGPRNGVPAFYDTAKVAEILNAHKDRILAVRGIPLTVVDPVMAGCAVVFVAILLNEILRKKAQQFFQTMVLIPYLLLTEGFSSLSFTKSSNSARPVFLIACKPKRMESPSTVKRAVLLLMSGGRMVSPIFSHSLM